MDKKIFELLNEIDNQVAQYEDIKDTKKEDIQEVKKHKNKFLRPIFTISAAACLTLFALGFLPQTRKVVYAKVEEISFELSKLLDLNKDISSYTDIVNKSITKDGVTINIKEIMVDEETLTVEYKIVSDKEIDENKPLSFPFDLFINNEEIPISSTGEVKYIDAHTELEIHTIYVPNIKTSNKLYIEFAFSKWVAKNKTEEFGRINFTTTKKELSHLIKNVEINKSFTLPDNTVVTLKKFTNSGVSNRIYMTATRDLLELPSYELALTGKDNLGNNLYFELDFFYDTKGFFSFTGYTEEVGSDIFMYKDIDSYFYLNNLIDENTSSITLQLHAFSTEDYSKDLSIGEPFTINLK